jgi:hypothetical protein
MEIKEKSKFGDKKTINTHIFNQFERKEAKAKFCPEKERSDLTWVCACRWGSKDSPILWPIDQKVNFVTL